jgi:hypothetical protein
MIQETLWPAYVCFSYPIFSHHRDSTRTLTIDLRTDELCSIWWAIEMRVARRNESGPEDEAILVVDR